MLHLPARIRNEIATAALQGYPRECCGLLLGGGGGGDTRVERMVPARNLDTARPTDRYELAPEDLLAADSLARAQRLDIVGVWHSHPDHPARPSESDEQAAWADWSYLIAGVARSGLTDLRSWRLVDRRFVEEVLSVPEDGEAA
jgi:proteasome lid subunit RPN8/RPN11